MADAVWVDVLPNMSKFFPAFSKGAGPAAEASGATAASSFVNKFTSKGSSLLKGSMGSLIGISSVAGIGAGIINIGKTFEGLRNSIAKSTGASGKDLDNLMTVARNVSTQSAASYGDIGTAVSGLHQKLDLTGKPLQDMSKQILQLSSLTKTDLTTNINNSAGMFNKWGISTANQSKMLDMLYRASTASGVSVTDLSQNVTKFQPTLQGMGFSLQDSLGLFAQFGKAGISSSQVMTGMGKAMATWAKAGKSAPKEMMDLTEKIKNAKTPTEATALAVTNFGTKAGPALASAIRSGKLNVQQMMATIRDGKTTISGTTKETGTLSGKWTVLSHTLQNAAAPAAMSILDGLTRLATTITGKINPAVNAFTKGWQDNTGAGGKARQELDEIGRSIQTAGGWISRHTTTVKNLAIGFGALLLITKSVTAATKAQEIGYMAMKGVLTIVKIAQTGFTVAQWLMNAAMSANPIALVVIALVALGAGLVIAYKKSATFRAVVTAAWNGIKTGVSVVWTWLKGVFNAMGQFFTTTIPNALRATGSWFSSVWNGMKTVGLTVWHFMYQTFVYPYVYFFGTRIPNAVKFLGRVFSDAWTGMGKDGSAAWGFIKSFIIQPFINFFTVTMHNALSNFGSHFKNMWNGLKALAAKPVNFIINTVWNNGLRKALNLIPGVNLGTAKTISGFRSGGYTGDGRRDDPAGVVHGREFVMDADTTAAGGGAAGMERLRQGIRAGLWPVGPAGDAAGMADGNIGHLPGAFRATMPGDILATIRRGPGKNDRGYGWSGQQAVQWGEARIGDSGWYRLCLAFVNRAWQRLIPSLNQATARASMNIVPRTTKGTPPPGAAVYWDTGSAGHVALSVGDGSVLSNDIITPGVISRVALSYISQKWGAPYRGWWSPDGQAGSGNATYSGDSGSGLFSGLLSKITGAFTNVKNAALKGLTSPWGKLLTGVPGYAISKATSWVKSKISGLFGGGSGKAGNMESWRSTIAQALKATGIGGGAADENLWLKQVMTESGGNPREIQSSSVYDVNIAHGDPARGLLQIPGVTWADFGGGMGTFIPNVYNPLKNAIVAMRDAAGSYRNWRAVIGHGHGYNSGTSNAKPGLAFLNENGLGELVTSPTAALMRGGEHVYSSADTRRILNGGGDLRFVSGVLDISDDGKAFIYGTAVDAVNDNAAAIARRSA